MTAPSGPARQDSTGLVPLPQATPPAAGVDPTRPGLASATPARVFLGSVGTTLRTDDLLMLRADHAAAKDAVRARFDDEAGALEPLVAGHGMFTVSTRADTPQAYLRRPDLGRLLSEEGAARVTAEGTSGATVQLVVADGLSARAVGCYAPAFVAAFAGPAAERGWTLGRLIAVKHARVGLMNEIGELLRPEVVLLLIGERPGLDVQAGMSAYFGYRPDRAHTDADRSLISNIHDDGIPPENAAQDAATLVAQLLATRASGVSSLLAAHEQRQLPLGLVCAFERCYRPWWLIHGRPGSQPSVPCPFCPERPLGAVALPVIMKDPQLIGGKSFTITAARARPGPLNFTVAAINHQGLLSGLIAQ